MTRTLGSFAIDILKLSMIQWEAFGPQYRLKNKPTDWLPYGMFPLFWATFLALGYIFLHRATCPVRKEYGWMIAKRNILQHLAHTPTEQRTAEFRRLCKKFHVKWKHAEDFEENYYVDDVQLKISDEKRPLIEVWSQSTQGKLGRDVARYWMEVVAKRRFPLRYFVRSVAATLVHAESLKSREILESRYNSSTYTVQHK